MEQKISVEEYLQRIEVDPPEAKPDLDYLIRLHTGHLTHIPFETFDLIDLKELVISLDYVFERLVRQHRGGVCYQLNGLFAAILKQLGYDVHLIPCSVYNVDKKIHADDYGHVAMIVKLADGQKYLCDVGFSRDFLTPLFFQTDSIQYAMNGFFRLIRTDDQVYYRLERGYLDQGHSLTLPSSTPLRTHLVDIDPEQIHWLTSYRFRTEFLQRTTSIEDFQSACSYTLHSPDVRLNYMTICRIQTIEPQIGAYGIVNKDFYHWKIVNGVELQEHWSLSTDDDDQCQLKTLLKEKFGLNIERKLPLV